ncbi:MAG TPA: NADPH-dependent FMN reductase [Burkholderiaceae bacterium]|nr:NADPH-dependent FMN reductase [Burkholderiaceae bacterium]
MSTELHVAGLCGSLRARSYNRTALEAAGALMPAGMRLRIESFAQLPVYNPDDQAGGWPPGLLALGDALRDADAVLIASPEYNFGIPGGLKNAIDWLSRLPDQPFKNKPVAILGASPGPVGTVRMQYDLRRTLHYLDAHVLLKPEVFIGHAPTKFDEQGRLVDETTRKFLADQMVALQAWIGRVRAMG